MLARSRLLFILKRSHSANRPEKALDRIYLMVLGNAIRNDLSNEEKEEVLNHLRHILGTIAILFTLLPIVGLTSLLNV
jgi:hypothetical protein